MNRRQNDRFIHIIRSLVIVFAVVIIALLCRNDSNGRPDRQYVRYRGMDIALYESEGNYYVFLPSYADESRVRLGHDIKKLDPILLKSSGLPTIFITTSSGHIDDVLADKEYREPGKIYVYDEKGNLLLSEGLEYLKGRGNYSWTTEEWPKKPFSICTKRETSILNQPKGRRFALIANASDDTLIRNDLARCVQETLGAEYAKRGSFADLYIDGDYMGIYYLCSTIEVGEERISIEGSGTDITGGYLLERELPDRYELELPTILGGIVTKENDHFILSSPSYPTDSQLAYITDYMNGVESAIIASDGKDGNGRGYGEYIDIPSFAITYLTEEIIKNYDGGVSSAYYYKDSDRSDPLLHTAPGWDYDMSLGSYQPWMEYEDPEGLTMLYPHDDASRWYKALYEKEEYRDLVMSMYRENRDEIADILYGSGTEELKNLLSDAYKLEYIRWKDMYDTKGTIPGSEEAYERLKCFAKARIEYLDSVW